MKKILFLISLVSTLGCENLSQNKKSEKEIPSISYFKDPSTELCFAMVEITSHELYVKSITYVPCTVKVENLIKQ